MEASPVENTFWNTPLANIISLAGVDPTSGLTAQEASARLIKFGPNVATDIQRQPLWLQFLQRFRNPLIILLLIASILSLLTGDRASFIIIMAMLLLSVTLDFFQEVRAEKTVDALRESVAIKATALRNGQSASLLVRDIVPGDIVLLSPGVLIPADGRLISCKDLYVNQALLTGESYPSEKNAADLTTSSQDPGDATNAVFMGTSVISGSGIMIVTATGKKSRLGGLAGTLALRHPPTTFERGVAAFGMMILRLTVALVLFVLLINLGLNRPLLESFLFALALAVGLTPELLPMIVTITLARGAARMAKQKVVIKHLPAMHNLGEMDILCTDKTGTLTEADIQLVSSLNYAGTESETAFTRAYINSFFETGIKSPLDQAILTFKQPDMKGWTKIDEVPFDFERRRVSVLAENGDRRFLIVKGAPEDILKISKTYETAAGTIEGLDQQLLGACTQKFESLGEQGLRVLAVAFKEVDATHTSAALADEENLTFSGFLTFIDPPKASAADALKSLAKSGVAVKVISGDNERVTRHVCEMIGFDTGDVLTGDILSTLSDEALSARIEGTNVFCRVTPQQKSRIIAALKRRGHTVGFLGDGINDAAALHEADVGISVDSGADVAKAAADVILLEHDLSVIHAGVLEGRRAVENTEKYILMGSSSNFGNMFSMAGATLFLPFLPMLPTQILLNNLLYDLSQTVLPFDNVDDDALTHAVHWDIGRIRRFMWILGPVSSLFDFLTFYVLLKLFPGNEKLFHTGWFVESLVTQVLIVFAIRTHKFILHSRPHRYLVCMALAIAATCIALPFTPLGAWFGLEPLPQIFFIFLGTALVAYFLLVEIVKHVFRRII